MKKYVLRKRTSPARSFYFDIRLFRAVVPVNQSLQGIAPPITAVLFALCLFLPILGCSNPNSATVFNAGTGRHDTAGWLPGQHATVVKQSTVSACIQCHGPDLDGGISGVSCVSCHLGGSTNIHPQSWEPVVLDHGRYAAANGSRECSNRYCHGADLGGVAQSGPSCSACHLESAAGVHSSSWKTPALDHASYVSTNGTTSCSNLNCHGTGLEGVDRSGPSCTSCHIGDPAHVHPAIWDPVSRDHAAYAKANGTTACSNQYCHGTGLAGIAQSGPSCSSCHLGGTTRVHPSEWTSPVLDHKAYAETNGVLGCSNAACHGTTLAGVQGSGPACDSCHLGGATRVHPDTWSTVSVSHGPYVTANGTTVCASMNCHGADLRGVAGSGPSCTSCHLGDTAHFHPLAWTNVPLAHGPYATADGTASCANQACHGASLAGVAQSGPSCSSCHLGGNTRVHPSVWGPVSQGHASYAKTNGTSSCATEYCHGTTLSGVTESGPSCSSCHLGGNVAIHPSDWAPIYSTHGPYATANGTAACSNGACHGTTLEGIAGSGPACTSCHSWPYNAATVTCGACHRIPPTGDSFPNLAGRHAEHATSAVATCDICHQGASAYVGNHSNGTIDFSFRA